MPPTRYKNYLEEVRQKYVDRMGHLYVDMPAVKPKRKLETIAH